MTLTCLVCHNVDSPSHSFRSYSVSSSSSGGNCSAVVNCLARKVTNHSETTNTRSKVVPVPSNYDANGPPRLIRSRAVSRDLVRDWNFDQIVVEG